MYLLDTNIISELRKKQRENALNRLIVATALIYGATLVPRILRISPTLGGARSFWQ